MGAETSTAASAGAYISGVWAAFLDCGVAVVGGTAAAATMAAGFAAKSVQKNYINGVSPERATFKEISPTYQKMFDKLVSLYEKTNFIYQPTNTNISQDSILHFLNQGFLTHLNTLCENMSQSNTGHYHTRNLALLTRIVKISNKVLKNPYNNNIVIHNPTCCNDNKSIEQFYSLESNFKEELEKLTHNISLIDNIHNSIDTEFDENSNFYRGIDINIYKAMHLLFSMQKTFSKLLEYDIGYHDGTIKGLGTHLRRNTVGLFSWATNSGYSFKEVAEILKRLKESSVDTFHNKMQGNRNKMETANNSLNIYLKSFAQISYIFKNNINDTLNIKYIKDVNNYETINLKFGNLDLEHNWHSFANQFNHKIHEINSSSNTNSNFNIKLIVVSSGDEDIAKYGLPQDDRNLIRFVFVSENNSRFEILSGSSILPFIGFSTTNERISMEKKYERQGSQQIDIINEQVIVSDNNLDPDISSMKTSNINSSTNELRAKMLVTASDLGGRTIARINNLDSQATNNNHQ